MGELIDDVRDFREGMAEGHCMDYGERLTSLLDRVVTVLTTPADGERLADELVRTSKALASVGLVYGRGDRLDTALEEHALATDAAAAALRQPSPSDLVYQRLDWTLDKYTKLQVQMEDLKQRTPQWTRVEGEDEYDDIMCAGPTAEVVPGVRLLVNSGARMWVSRPITTPEDDEDGKPAPEDQRLQGTEPGRDRLDERGEAEREGTRGPGGAPPEQPAAGPAVGGDRCDGSAEGADGVDAGDRAAGVLLTVESRSAWPPAAWMAQNFCRVYRLPMEYPEGFLFAGSKPVAFTMVDWFNPLPRMSSPGDEHHVTSVDEWKAVLQRFVRTKGYYNPAARFLVVCDFGEAVMIEPEGDHG